MLPKIQKQIYKDFPPPSSAKVGWPWTKPYEASQVFVEDSKLPRISVVTPSYNQGDFIEETIRSVLLQGYPDLEYIIIDGGSTDNTIEIIKKYEPWITYWMSEPDRGQTHALNKGLEKSTGEVWSYLNSDDLLLPNSLKRIGELFQNPELSWVGAASDQFNQSSVIGQVKPQPPALKAEYFTPWHRSSKYIFPCSNVSFMRRSLMVQCGMFDESYEYGMDIEYYLRVVFQAGIEPQLISDVLGSWRWHPDSKTMKQGIAYGFREDEVRMAIQYLDYLDERQRTRIQQEILEQQKWLVTRKAMFYKSQGHYRKAIYELISHIKTLPGLLLFRPWYGAIRTLIS